jgi:hypothetical protein
MTNKDTNPLRGRIEEILRKQVNVSPRPGNIDTQHRGKTTDKLVDLMEEQLLRKWIKVTDRIPAEGQTVIFGKNNMTDLQNRLARPYVMAGWYSCGTFFSYFTKDKSDATHWMPMPELKNG